MKELFLPSGEGDPLRVVYVLRAFPVPSERFIEREVQALGALGVELKLAILRTPRTLNHMLQTLAAAAVATFRAPRSALRALLELNKLRGTERNPLAILWRFADSARIVSEIEAFAPHVIHAHFVNTPATVARLASTWLDTPWGASAHAHDIYVDDHGLALRLMTASHIVACSETTAHYLRTLLDERTAPAVRCVHHGLHIPAPMPTRVGEAVIVAAGRFVPKKGFDVLLRALARLRDMRVRFHARLVGAGSQEAVLRLLVHQRNLGKVVEIEGWKEPSEMERVLRDASVLVVPSLIDEQGDRDNVPNILVEGLALGLPVIASNIPSLAALAGERAMLLVEAGNDVSLAEALAGLLSSPDLSASLARTGRAFAARQFDVQRNCRLLREIFRVSATGGLLDAARVS